MILCAKLKSPNTPNAAGGYPQISCGPKNSECEECEEGEEGREEGARGGEGKEEEMKGNFGERGFSGRLARRGRYRDP